MAETTEPRTHRRRSVLIAYGIVTLVGAFFFAFSFEYEFFRGDTSQVGPAFLPRITAVLVILLGLALMRQEAQGGSVLSGDSGIAEDTQALDTRTVRKLALVFGLMTAALLLLPLVGLLVPLVALVLVLTLVVERMPLVPSLCVTAGAGALGYVLFVLVLSIPLPMGLLGGAL